MASAFSGCECKLCIVLSVFVVSKFRININLISLSMKKFMISLAVASIAMFSYAQGTNEVVEVPTVKHSVATNSFGSNWFVGVNGGVNLYNGVYMNGESVFDHLSPALNVHVGKWHTPGFGWRVAYQGLNIQTYEKVDHTAFMNFHFDAMFNLSNLFCGYNESRIWNAIPYVGAGWAGREAMDHEKFDDITGSISVNYGLINTFRVAKRWAINLELAGAFFRNGFSGRTGSQGHDMMWNATVGVTYRIGKVGWEPTVDLPKLQADYNNLISGLKNRLDQAEANNAALSKKLAGVEQELAVAKKQLAECDAKEGANVKESIFFAFDSYKIASKKEELNIRDYAEAAAKAGKKLVVRGYADKTGDAAYNKNLSQKRADAVAALLEKYGAAVEIKIGEGVSEAENARFLNRRVTIELAD